MGDYGYSEWSENTTRSPADNGYVGPSDVGTHSSAASTSSASPVSAKWPDTQMLSDMLRKTTSDAYVSVCTPSMYGGDISVQVTDAKHIGGEKEGYVVYTIKTRGERNGETVETEIKRRFSEFYSLLYSLHEQFPHLFMPAFPPKTMAIYGDKFDPDVVMHRRVCLERFLRQSLMYSTVAEWEGMWLFLTSDRPIPGTEQSASGLIDDLFEKISITISGDKVKNVVCTRFMDGLIMVGEHAKRLTAAVDSLQASMRKGIERNERVARALMRIGEKESAFHKVFAGMFCAQQIAVREGTRRLGRVDPGSFQIFRDFQRSVNAAKTVVSNLDQYHEEQEQAILRLEKYHEERDAEERLPAGSSRSLTGFFQRNYESLIGLDAEQAKQERIKKFDMLILCTKEEIESGKKQCLRIDKMVGNSFNVFMEMKSRGIRDAVEVYVESEREYHVRSHAMWHRFHEMLTADN